MNNLVLDTDIFVDYLRKYEKAGKFFDKLRSVEDIIYFSAITEVELISGNECNNFEVKAKLLNFLSNFSKIPVDNQIAVRAGDFRRIHGIQMPDAIVAATAFAMKAKLVTRNARDYSKIDEVKISIPY